MPDVLTVWSLAVLVIGGLMYAVMSRSSRSAAAPTLAVRRPGWIARRRARGGIRHRDDRVGVGYRSAVGAVHLTARQLGHHGAVFGGPGSAKTTFLQLLVEASAGELCSAWASLQVRRLAAAAVLQVLPPLHSPHALTAVWQV